MKDDRSYGRSRRFGPSPQRSVSSPPTPSVLIGQILGALAIFALLAFLLWSHSAPPCDADLVGAGAPCVETDGARVSQPALVE